MKHPLLANSFVYKKVKAIESPEQYSYDKKVGAWINNIDKTLLVLNKDFPATGTKKNDIETGEDQKGQ